MIDWTKWKLVPVEPNAAMVEAGISAIKQAPDVGGICAEYTAEAYDAYTAMLAAAPPAPVGRPLCATLSAETREEVIREVVKDDGGLEMALAQAAAIIERLNRERSQIKHGLQGLVDYLGDAERANSHPAPRAAAVIALRHAFNSAATILKAMHEAECRMDQRK